MSLLGDIFTGLKFCLSAHEANASIKKEQREHIASLLDRCAELTLSIAGEIETQKKIPAAEFGELITYCQQLDAVDLPCLDEETQRKLKNLANSATAGDEWVVKEHRKWQLLADKQPFWLIPRVSQQLETIRSAAGQMIAAARMVRVGIDIELKAPITDDS